MDVFFMAMAILGAAWIVGGAIDCLREEVRLLRVHIE